MAILIGWINWTIKHFTVILRSVCYNMKVKCLLTMHGDKKRNKSIKSVFHLGSKPLHVICCICNYLYTAYFLNY